MPVNYECFIELAKGSLENTGEQWTRNAISRAYYAMYHSALRVVDGKIPTHDENGTKLPGGSHQRFYDYLCDGVASKDHNLDPVLTKKLGLKLKTNHYLRVSADYKLKEKINRVSAISSIYDVEEVEMIAVKLLEQHSNLHTV
ncbi:hypothetical protein V2154_15610 [Ewingella sp. CoE-038-23]|uniref:hypothetical protein n=1 Tax=Ewingella docleensis TaxID=3118588 RepID=UPI003365A5AB